MYGPLKIVFVDSDLFLHGLGVSGLLIEMREALQLWHILQHKIDLAR